MIPFLFLKNILMIEKTLNKYLKHKNKFINSLDHEFKTIQKLFLECNHFNEICTKTGLTTKNKEGSYLNKVLCIYENKILMECAKKIGYDNIGCLIFDGFLRLRHDVKNRYWRSIKNIK